MEWQKNIYYLNNEIIAEELNIIVKLITIDDLELLDMCVEASRVFDNEMGHKYVASNSCIIKDIREKSENAGITTKKYWKIFYINLHKFYIALHSIKKYLKWIKI